MTEPSHKSPLFPLGTVLMPNGPIMLRIFEPRYLDMVTRCMREDEGFVVTLINKGSETGKTQFRDVGTLAKIVDWHQYDDGVLGITALGQQRVRIKTRDRQADGLNIGEVEIIPDDPVTPLPEDFGYLVRLLEQLIEQLGEQYSMVDVNYGDAGWVGSRLAEILPMPNDHKQTCLEMLEPLGRLEVVAAAVKEMTRREN
ncbi:MAG: LON peptidase substrate-binding domain-containing protein [Gammaproteobacteria bacterium]